ncbi:MAG: amidohydrolase family protein [Verrucomicrobiota bacterium]
MNPIIDVNVNLSRWPFRRLVGDDTSSLMKKLREKHVTQAWAGTFDGLLHKDISSANARLAKECREQGQGVLLPFGSINPKLPDWEEDLRRCHEEHKMRGIRLHPNYHGYKLDEPVFTKLLDSATQRGLIVQLAVLMEDKRTQHPLAEVAPVDLAPLPDLLKPFPKLKIVLLNSLQGLNGKLLLRLAGIGRIYFEIATLEGVGGIGKLIEQIPASKILFGSHAPFFYFESALLKVKESSLQDSERNLILAENARRLLDESF